MVRTRKVLFRQREIEMRNKPVSGAIAAIAAMMMSAAPAYARDTATQSGEVSEIGLPAGVVAPEISVVDSEGSSGDLASIMGDKGVVLAFVRSVRWCPFCRKQLMQLNDIADDVRAQGYELVSISYDEPKDLAKFKKKRKLNYQFVSDPGSQAIQDFGLLNTDYEPGTKAYGVPHPAIYLITPDRQIQAKLMEEGFKVRPPSSAVLAMIAEYDGAEAPE